MFQGAILQAPNTTGNRNSHYSGILKGPTPTCFHPVSKKSLSVSVSPLKFCVIYHPHLC